MKVSMIFPRFTGPFGGERLVLRLAEAMAAENELMMFTRHYEPDIIKLKEAVSFTEVGYLNNIGGSGVKNIIDMFFMPALARKVPLDSDVIIGVGWQAAFALFWLKRFRGINADRLAYLCLEPPRFLYDLNDEIVGTAPIAKRIVSAPVLALIKQLDHHSVKSIRTIIAISEWTQNQLKGIYGKSSVIVYPGIEFERFSSSTKSKERKRLGIPQDAVVYMTASKLHPRKRLDLSLDEYRKLRVPGSAYYLIGDGPQREALLENIKLAGDVDIHYLGKLSDEDVASYMIASDFFIFTAKNEPFGMAPLEAKAAGCEVLPEAPHFKPESWDEVAGHVLGVVREAI